MTPSFFTAARGSRLSGLLCALLPLATGASAELELKVTPGIEQQRNFDRPGSWSRQWVRSLPPGNLPHTVVAHGPSSWIGQAGPLLTPAETAAANQPHLPALLAALETAETLLEPDPAVLAGRVVALLRPVELRGEVAPGRRARLWLLWEVLADAQNADTLSAAFAAAQTLRLLDVSVRLASYPAVTRTYAYGLLLPGAGRRMEKIPGAVAVGADLLLPLSLLAKPLPDLGSEQLTTWSWEEILSPGWTATPRGLTLPEVVPEVAPDPEPPPIQSLEEYCEHILALGFRCVEAPPVIRDRTLAWISASLVALLLTGTILALRYGWLRRKRVELLRVDRQKRAF